MHRGQGVRRRDLKVLGICGSCREDSNTNKLVKKVAMASGCDYELVYFGSLDIRPCTGCSACLMNEGQCVIQDDMQGLYDKLLAADGLIVGSPTYFMDVSGAVKTFIDRTMAIRYRGIGPEYKAGMPWLGTVPLAGRPMVPVVTVAGGGHERAVETLKVFADDCQRMKIVARVVEVVGMNDVSDMPEVLQRAQDAGKKLYASLQKQ